MARKALAVGRAALPEYGSRFSRRDYTQAQLFALLVLRQSLQTDYRGTVALVAEWAELRRTLGLSNLPHYSTLAHASRRILADAKAGGAFREAQAVVVHAHSHLILGAVPGVGPSQDSPDLTPAMQQAAGLVQIGTALRDAGYDAEHNHRLCREDLGIRQTVIRLNRRNTGCRRPKTS